MYPARIWAKEDSGDVVYLTFDDGPVPGVTDYVLEELAKRDQKATFFVVGDNVRKNPSLAREILDQGHKLGNHTFNHLNGWKTEQGKYLENIARCDRIIEDLLGIRTQLFRPPYGMMRSAQAAEVLSSQQIVMWSMLSGDYDQNLKPELVVKKSIQHTRIGCIAVFHDQQKTKNVLPKVLPRYLDYIREKKWKTGLL
ncbi:polysaccharide deacetylase family protein [Algoriphagus sp. AGSA1]|uniref:polysaccharide deacetylase family protein n=1 Tax=Algoriphagus sp. AGSA1 TaxID=2907213 RepID=UPI0027959BDF|nr:polysaccharide deacetylase family protein [Algoriphagus sp. AGSA1]